MMNNQSWNQEIRDRIDTTVNNYNEHVGDKNQGSKSTVKTIDKILLRGHSQPQLIAQQQHEKVKI